MEFPGLLTLNCSTCDYVQEGKQVKSTQTSAVANINAAVDCRTSNVVYCVNCTKPRCRLQYVGKTVSEFRTRMSAHRSYVGPKPKLDKATGEHFNRPGHKCADMGVTILEKVFNKDPMFLTVREEFWIRQFNSKYKNESQQRRLIATSF